MAHIKGFSKSVTIINASIFKGVNNGLSGGVLNECILMYFLFCIFLQWFWGSIQMDARAGESMYSYEKVRKPLKYQQLFSFVSFV